MKSLADSLGFLPLWTGGFFTTVDRLLLMARFAERQDEVDAPTSWLPLFFGLGLFPAITLADGVLLTPKLGHK